MKRDIFDTIAPDPDPALEGFKKKLEVLLSEKPDDEFDRIEREEQALENIKEELESVLTRFDHSDRNAQISHIVEEVKSFVRDELKKIKPVQHVIERQVEQVIKHVDVPVHLEPRVVQAPPQIVKEVRVEVPATDKRALVEKSDLDKALKKIEELEERLKETDRIARAPMVFGGSGVIGIPPPEGNEGKTLKVSGNKAVWTTVTGGGGASISGYTVNDATTLKTLPADASIDELRQVLGTLLTELQA